MREGNLEVAGLCHGYAGEDIVSGVSFDVLAGEVICLLGPSGSGKTTVLRLIAGLERPAKGRIVLDGKVMTGPGTYLPPEDRSVGMMFQDYALFPHLSLVQNVMFGLADVPRPRAYDLALGLLERVGLGARLDDYPHMLSGGEQQRLSLARTLAPGPCVVLMDEPFSNLDQRLRQHMREATLALLAERRTSAIIVTHDPAETMLIADRIVLLQHGRVLQTGSPQELYARPASLFAARFLSELNEIAATCSAGVASCRLGRFPAPGVADGAAIVCFRPQAIAIVTTGGEVAATVKDCRFIGEGYRVGLAVDGVPSLISVHSDLACGSLEQGQRVQVRAAAGQALVFAAGPDIAATGRKDLKLE